MQEQEIYELLKENICVQDEALKKIIRVLNHNLNYSNFKQNILLIGERGSGKTTMIKEVANLFDINVSEVYDAFKDGEINLELFYTAFCSLYSSSEGFNGLLLMHDYQDGYIHGNVTDFNSMIASNALNLGDHGIIDVSNVTFVGEIDTTGMEDIFCEPTDSYDLNDEKFDDPILALLQQAINSTSKVYVDEDGNVSLDFRFMKKIINSIRNRFLSTNCSNAFPLKIYMDAMDTNEILNALSSPISALNLYKDDLDDEYINSSEFMKNVAYQVLESGEGLHFISKAIENTALKDYKKNEKVLKKGSLLIPTRK